jgi:hypothetical protein
MYNFFTSMAHISNLGGKSVRSNVAFDWKKFGRPPQVLEESSELAAFVKQIPAKLVSSNAQRILSHTNSKIQWAVQRFTRKGSALSLI